jgi:hypothetical protein
MQGVKPAYDLPNWVSTAHTRNSLPENNILDSNSTPIKLAPEWQFSGYTRRIPFVVRLNRVLKTVLITLCGLTILGYGLDVASSNDVSKLQDEARRLGEQNTELSAQLLKVISFQGIQTNVIGLSRLHVPEHVLIVKEVKPMSLRPFEPEKSFLPLMSGY